VVCAESKQGTCRGLRRHSEGSWGDKLNLTGKSTHQFICCTQNLLTIMLAQ
jgi:hypothetical protein